jgi:hypothetical protein
MSRPLKSKSASRKRKQSSRSNSKYIQPSNPKLYQKVISDAKKKFKVWPSAYASGWVVHEYKRRGGTYQQESPLKKSPSRRSSSLKRWFDEVWINVCYWPKIVPCGRSGLSMDSYEKQYPYCRPLNRITSQTPKTARELSRNELKRRCRKKRRSPHKRVLE